ncbi:hypothetical protein GGF32_000866 [Allomyces javanicus]|nr:hypothetical protein GGF32_000866 [Allomyces javanicus]
MSATPSISDDFYETTHESVLDFGSATPCAWPRSAPCTPAIKALYPLVLQHGLPARPTWVDEWDGLSESRQYLRSGASSTLTLVAGPDATPSAEGEPRTDDEWMAIAVDTLLPADDELELQIRSLVLARDAPEDAALHDRQRSAALSPRPYSPDTLDHLLDTPAAGLLLTSAPATALADLPSPPTPPPLTLTPSPDLVVALLHDHVTDLERTQHELHVLAHESCTAAEHLSAQLARQTAIADQVVHLARRTAFPDLDPALVSDAPYLARLEDRYRREHAEMMALLAECDAVARNAERANVEAGKAREVVDQLRRKCGFEGTVESPEDVDRMVASVMLGAEAKVMTAWPVPPVDGSVAARAMHVRDTLVNMADVPVSRHAHVQAWARFMQDVIDEVRYLDRAVAHERNCRAEVEAALEAKEMEAQQTMRRVEDLQLEMDRVLVETEDIVRRSEVEVDELYDRLDAAEDRAGEASARAQEEEARRGRVETEWAAAVRENETRMATVERDKSVAQADAVAARAQLDEERARNRDMQGEFDEERARTRSLQRDLDEERARNRALQRELDGTSEQLWRVKADLDAHIAKSTSDADRLAAVNECVRRFEANLAETTARTSTLESDLSQATCDLASSRADLAATQAALSTTQSDLAARTKDLERARSALRIARRSLLSQLRARSDLQAALDAAVEARQRAKQERDTALVRRDAAMAERDSAVLECVQMTREWRSGLAQLETDVRLVQQNESAELDRSIDRFRNRDATTEQWRLRDSRTGLVSSRRRPRMASPDRLRDTERSLQQCSAERDAGQLIQAALRAQLQHWRAQSAAAAADAEDRSAWSSVPAVGGGTRAAVAAVVKKGLGRMLGSAGV